MNLTDEQLNLAVGEWMGWTHDLKEQYPWQDADGEGYRHPPDYLSDDSPRRLLNEVEARLTEQQFEDYYSAVEAMTPVGRPQHKRRALLSATARQRTIAILKTVKPEMFL